LSKFKKYCEDNHSVSFELLQINDIITDLVKKKEHRDIEWHTILQYPYSKLKGLWEQAFEIILTSVKLNAEKNYIVIIHSCYFHQYTKEFISFGGIDLLKTFDPDCIITFIDDIEDIHLRLKKQGRIFAEDQMGAAPKSLDNIVELKQVLQWRAFETTFSRFYASTLWKEHVLLAVKHPCLTLYRLIFEREKYKTVYLSHPISKMRRMYWRGELAQADQEIMPITEYTNELTQADGSICYFPTSIDEFRFKVDEAGMSLILSKRWQQEFYEKKQLDILYVHPLEEFDSQAKNYLPFYTQIEKNFAGITDEQIKKQWLFQVNLLMKHILDEIGIRDKVLVEQSEFILVYRPYLEGRISGGVEEEIIYKSALNPNLKSHGAVFFPVEDKRDFQTMQLKEVFIDTFRKRDAGFRFLNKDSDPTEAILTVINRDVSRLDIAYQSIDSLSSFIQYLNTELIRLGIVEPNDSVQPGAMDGQKASLARALYREMASGVYNALDGVLKKFTPGYEVFDNKYKIRDVIRSIPGEAATQ